MTTRALLFGSLAIALLVASPSTSEAACPCYTASSAYNEYSCAIEAQTGTNPTVAQWNDLFAAAALGPASWGTRGPNIADIGQGCGKPEPFHKVDPVFPCELVKAMMYLESTWRQFCVPDSPLDQVGKSSRTVISFDCGYGISQVTSGMHQGETTSFDRTRVAKEPFYNLATGLKILAGKWSATACVGDNQPLIIESWYTAVWAYNGLSYINNPNNPNYDADRGVWKPSVRNPAPYQEKVFGFLEAPPSTNHWAVVKPGYPKLSDIGNSSGPGALPLPKCASPTSCANTRGPNKTACTKDTVQPQPEPEPPPDELPPTEPSPDKPIAVLARLPPNATGVTGTTGCSTTSTDTSSLALMLLGLAALILKVRRHVRVRL
jgi:MYXO-CTERM domain-containing protein